MDVRGNDSAFFAKFGLNPLKSLTNCAHVPPLLPVSQCDLVDQGKNWFDANNYVEVIKDNWAIVAPWRTGVTIFLLVSE
jgi:hypothetical protein